MVVVLALEPDGRMVAGGNFVTFGGMPACGLADVNVDGTPFGLLRLQLPVVEKAGRVRLPMTVVPNEAFTLETSTDLIRWRAVVRDVSATNRIEIVDPEPLGGETRFYRLRQ